jgi:hypothetical protein
MIFRVHLTNRNNDQVGYADIEAPDMLVAGAIGEIIEDVFYKLNTKYHKAIKTIKITKEGV